MKQQLIWGEWYKNKKTGKLARYVPLHPGQKAIHESDARFLFFISGKGAAKSSYAPIWLEREIRKNPRGRFIVCAPTYYFLDQGIKDHFFKHMQYSDLKGEWIEYKKQYHLSTGGVVYFRSLDDPERINAIHAHAIVCDEGLNISKRAYDILESRVALTKGRILVTSTPYRKYRWAMEMLERANHDPNYFCLQVPSNLNPAFTNDEFERLQATKPRWQFEQDYLGKFAQPDGIIYGDLRNCVAKVSCLPSGTYHAGVDWGHGAAPTSAIVGVLDSDDVLWVFWEYYVRPNKSDKTSSFIEAARSLKAWHNEFYKQTGHSVSRWWCDSATDTWKHLRRYRLAEDDYLPALNAKPAKKGAGSVDYGIDLVNARIATGKLKIVEGTVTALLEESDYYRYEVDEDGNGSATPKGECHALDALRYLILGIDRKRALIG